MGGLSGMLGLLTSHLERKMDKLDIRPIPGFIAAREVRDIVRDHHLAPGPGEPLNQDTRPDS